MLSWRREANVTRRTDENRERVVKSGVLPDIIALLADDSLLPYAIPVLYNICVDYRERIPLGEIILS
jgi:hypothetical protein